MSKYNIYALRLDRAFRAARAEYQQRQAAGKPEEAAQVWPDFERERADLTAELENDIDKNVLENWHKLVMISDFCTGQTQESTGAAIAAGNWWENLSAEAMERLMI